jgi:hypothetical protein
MQANDGPIRAFEALSKHEHLAELVGLTRTVARELVSAKKTEWPKGARAQAEEAKLTVEAAATSFGDPIATLERGPESDSERALCAALFAHVVAEEPTKELADEDKLAEEILWLAAHTAFDATSLLDRGLGEAADALWSAIADRVRRIEAQKLPSLGRGEALLGCAALALSTSPAAVRVATTLSQELRDPLLLHVLANPSGKRTSLMPDAKPTARISGEISPVPQGPVLTVLLSVTGILLAWHTLRLLAKVALAYKRPAELVLSKENVRIDSHVEILGRTLQKRSTVIGRDALARAGREVKYPRLGFYAGLLALAIGSYLGVSTFVDGVRASSPSLLLTGLLIVAAGVGLDLLLSSILPSKRGLCRVVIVPRKGPSICVGAVDVESADRALAALAPGLQ